MYVWVIVFFPPICRVAIAEFLPQVRQFSVVGSPPPLFPDFFCTTNSALDALLHPAAASLLRLKAAFPSVAFETGSSS